MSAVKAREQRVKKGVYLPLVYARGSRISFFMESHNPATPGIGISITFLRLTWKILQNKNHFKYSQGTGLLQDLCSDLGCGIENSRYFQRGPKVLTVKETRDLGA